VGVVRVLFPSEGLIMNLHLRVVGYASVFDFLLKLIILSVPCYKREIIVGFFAHVSLYDLLDEHCFLFCGDLIGVPMDFEKHLIQLLLLSFLFLAMVMVRLSRRAPFPRYEEVATCAGTFRAK
jgi:hypothetical protein